MSSLPLKRQNTTQAADFTAAVPQGPTMAPDRPTGLSQRHRVAALLLEWTLLSSLPLLAVLMLKPQLMHWWTRVIALWSARLELPIHSFAMDTRHGRFWDTPFDGTFMPSSQTLAWSWLGLIGLWTITFFFSDRFHPLKVILRALCLIQATACIFFLVSPAHFPYTVNQHMHALLDMGFGLMLATGPMLALGWGILTPSRTQKILVPLGILAYFACMLPHKVLLHAWLLAHGSALFMPILFLSFGTLFDLWVFIALYAWLASSLPMPVKAIGEAP